MNPGVDVEDDEKGLVLVIFITPESAILLFSRMYIFIFF